MKITGNKMVTNYSMLSNKTKGCLELIATNQLQMTKNVKVQKKYSVVSKRTMYNVVNKNCKKQN